MGRKKKQFVGVKKIQLRKFDRDKLLFKRCPKCGYAPGPGAGVDYDEFGLQKIAFTPRSSDGVGEQLFVSCACCGYQFQSMATADALPESLAVDSASPTE